jgi:hypothetical protein
MIMDLLKRLFGKTKRANMPGAADGSWQARMGWRYIAYKEGKIAFGLPIEPMICGADIVDVPTDAAWSQIEHVNSLSKKQVMRNLQSIPWNRALTWQETDNASGLSVNATLELVIPGSLEATSGGQFLESLRLFEPGDRPPFEQVRELWLKAERKFAEEARGEVTLFADQQGVPQSVFREITLVTLKNNPHVTLNFK